MASLETMKQWGMGLVVLGILFAVATAILTDIDTQVDDNETSAIQNALDAVSTFTGWFELIALVIVAAIVIGLVQRGFGGGGMQRGGRGRA